MQFVLLKYFKYRTDYDMFLKRNIQKSLTFGYSISYSNIPWFERKQNLVKNIQFWKKKIFININKDASKYYPNAKVWNVHK